MNDNPSIRPANNRALKEWDLACRRLRDGDQTVLIRKGGIREEEGVFRVIDSEFFLMPTFEHQNADLLQNRHRTEIVPNPDPRRFTIDAYALVDTVLQVEDEDALSRIEAEHIWNERYIQMRLDFNPYDPLYVLILRVFRLPQSVELVARPEYEGCRSWVTLEEPLSTAGAVPALSGREFGARAERIRALLGLQRNQNAESADSV